MRAAPRNDGPVVGRGETHFRGVDHVNAITAQERRRRARDALVQQKPSRGLKVEHLICQHCGRICKRFADVLVFDLRVVGL